MKRLSILLAGLCMSLAAMSQAIIKFEETEHDFGRIYEKDGDVSHEFAFTNEGDSALILTNVRASCGCTTPKWTKAPIEPGEDGKITVKYSTRNRPGKFTKTITVKTNNVNDGSKRLVIRGEVIPKATTAEEEKED